MKKKLALLMVISVLLGSTGCLPEKRDVEKGRLTKAQTEEEDDEPDEPETQATLQKYRGEVVHDLNCYTLNRTFYRRAYGAPKKETVEYWDNPVPSVSLWLERVSFEDYLLSNSNIQNLQDTLDEQFDELWEEYEKLYQEKLDDFVRCEKDGSDLPGAAFYSSVTIYRADDAITSLFISPGTNENSEFIAKDVNGNYRTEDASLILFDEVVKDRDAVRDYVKKMHPDSEEKALDELKKEEPVFTITYDGIVLPNSNVKIPAFGGLEDAFDLSYFSRVPYTYMLYMNEDYSLTWDFDNDGKMEKLSFRGDDTSDEFRLFMTMGDEEYEITKEQVPSLDYSMGAVPRYVLFEDNMAFVSIFLLEGDDGLEHYIHIPPGEIQEMGDYYPTLLEIYNPYSVLASSTERIIGGTIIYPNVTFVGAVPEPYDDWCEASTPVMQVQKDLHGKEFDYRTRSIGADTILEKDMMVAAAMYNLDTEQIVVKVLDPDESNVRYVLLETDRNEMTVAGENPYDAFLGLYNYI